MKPNIAARLNTDTPYIKELIADIKKGIIKIPQFQRKFVWKEFQAFNLLDSIANNYPVGSLLLWRTGLKIKSERNIGDFTLPETDDMNPTDYVLDGQQRLTVIYSAFGAQSELPGFSAGYDLNNEEFVIQPETHQVHVFPLRSLYDTTKLLNFRTGLIGHPDGSILQARLDGLLDVITNYRIPVVILKDLTVEEVCPIFERINSSGTRLSTYDLMVAATWTETFSLDVEVSEISDALEAKGFGDISGDTILKCLSAIQFESTKREKVISLRTLSHEEMDVLVEVTKDALLLAVELLVTEFKMYSWDFLPYEVLIVILAFIFSKKNILSADEVIRIRKWFWRSSFSERYRGASEAFATKDIDAINKYVINGKDIEAEFGEPLKESDFGKLPFKNDNSRTRAFILMLAHLHPRNITNGVHVDTTNALSSYNKKEFHHIYPQAYLRRQKESQEINCLANICILTASENKSISDKNPNEYFPELMKKNLDENEQILRSNALPLATEIDYPKATYQEFIQKRSKILSQLNEKLCEGEII